MPRATAARPQSADAELLDDALHSLEQTLLFIGEDQEPTNAKLGVAVGALLTLLGIGIAGAI